MSESVLMKFDLSTMGGDALEKIAKTLGVTQKEFKKMVTEAQNAAKEMEKFENTSGLKEMGVSIKDVAGELQKIKAKELKKIQEESAKAAKAAREQEQAIKASEKAIKEQERASTKATKEQERITKEAEKQKEAFAKIEAEAHKMNQQFDKMKMDKAQKEAEKVKKETEGIKKAAEDASKAVSDKMGAAFDKVQAAANRAAMALGAIGGLGVKNFAEFEKGVRQVQTISAASYEEISAVTKKMALESGSSLTGLNAALYSTVSAIGDVEGKYKVLDAANKLSIGGFTTTEKSVDVLTTVLNAYKMSTEEAIKISDILIMTQNKGKTTVDQLASALGNVIPTAAMTNVSFEQLSIGMALLTSNGIQTAEAGTALNAMFSELARGGTDADKMFKQVFGTNFSTYMQRGGDLGEALKQMGEEAARTGQSLLDIFNIRAVKGAATIFGDFDRWGYFSDEIMKAAGATESAYGKMMDTLDGQMSSIKETLRQVSINIGSALAPMVSDFANRLAEVDFEKVFSKENIDRITTTAKTLAILLVTIKGFGALGGVLKTVNTLGVAFKAFSGAGAAAGQITTLGAKVKALTSAFGLSSLGAGLAATGVLGVGAAAVYAGVKYAEYKNNIEELTQKMTAANNTTQEQTRAFNEQKKVLEELNRTANKYKWFDSNKKAFGNIIDSSTDENFKTLAKQYDAAREAYQKTLGKIESRTSDDGLTTMYFPLDSSKQKEELDRAWKMMEEYTENQELQLETKVNLDDLYKAKKEIDFIKIDLEKGKLIDLNIGNVNDEEIKNLVETIKKLTVHGQDATQEVEKLKDLLDTKNIVFTDEIEKAKENIEDLKDAVIDLAKEALKPITMEFNIMDSAIAQLDMFQSTQEMTIAAMIEVDPENMAHYENEINKFKAEIEDKKIELKIGTEEFEKAKKEAQELYDNGMKKLEEIEGLKEKHAYIKTLLDELKQYGATAGSVAAGLLSQASSFAEVYLNQIKRGDGAITPKESGKSGSKPEWQTALENYKKELETMPKFWDATGITDIEQVSNRINNVKNLMQALARGNKDTLFAQYKKDLDILQEELSKLNIAKIFEDYDRNTESVKTINELLGVDDLTTLKSQLNEAKQALTNMVRELQRQGLTDIEIKAHLDIQGLTGKIEALDMEVKASEEIERAKQAEKEAVQKIISSLDKFGSDMKELGEDLNSAFIKIMGEIMSSVAKFANGLNQFQSSGGMGSISGMFGSLGSLFGGGGGFNLASIAGGLTSLSGLATAGFSAFQLGANLISGLSGSAKRDKIDKENQENKAAFEAAKEAMDHFINAIKSARSSINSYSNSMRDFTAASPTLANIDRISKNYDLYINAMMNGLDSSVFGTITALEKGTARYSSWFSSRKTDKFTNVEIKESDLLRAMGITNTNINWMNEKQFMEFATQLQTFGIGDLEKYLGQSFTDDTFSEWKNGIEEYARQLTKLRDDQENLLKNSTLAAFEGIDLKSHKQLIDEYTDMYERLGLESAAYMDQIEEMARNTGAIVTAMQDVRGTWINSMATTGMADFGAAMSSYFSNILVNAAQVVYDVAYSSIDDYLTNEFEAISNKLVSMKKSGVLDFDGFWDDFNFNKILEADRIETEYAKVIDSLRDQLESRGISTNLINSILPPTELSQRIQNMREMLSSAMSTALDNNSFLSFTESLGQGIYDSVKDSLIQAFAESEVYKAYLNRFFDTATIEEQLNQVSTAHEGFNVIQEYLNNLDYQLEAAGLGRGDTVLASGEFNRVGESYYTPDSHGLTVQIIQYFDQVYGEDAMYSAGKRGALDAFEEFKEEAKIKSGGLA